jgi:putative N6-adenine-specific DNA methylase
MALPIFLPCAAGVEALLADEVAGLLPTTGIERRRSGVRLVGNPSEVMRLNLHSRLAQRVLVQVADGPYADEHGLYHLARQVDWRLWLTPRETLRVDVTTQHSPVKSLRYAALRIKDAVCDQQRDAFGERPSVDTRQPDLPLVLHLEPEHATLYVDTSGEALFKRGWRVDVGDAPLKETLAAAMLAAAGWRGTPASGGALHDPCCGSGTIVIEAAQIASGIAPGLGRHFAFERQQPFATGSARADWAAMREDARRATHAPAVPISASDVSFRMVDFARRNAERAGVADLIEFHGGDALQRPAPVLPPGLAGTLIVNPPYGERLAPRGDRSVMARERPLAAAPSGAPHDDAEHARTPRPVDLDGDAADAATFAARLATHWKQAYTGRAAWTAWVLSPDRDLPGVMRLKAARRIPMWNGPIECRLFRFDLVAGSMRDRIDRP